MLLLLLRRGEHSCRLKQQHLPYQELQLLLLLVMLGWRHRRLPRGGGGGGGDVRKLEQGILGQEGGAVVAAPARRLLLLLLLLLLQASLMRWRREEEVRPTLEPGKMRRCSKVWGEKFKIGIRDVCAQKSAFKWRSRRKGFKKSPCACGEMNAATREITLLPFLPSTVEERRERKLMMTSFVQSRPRNGAPKGGRERALSLFWVLCKDPTQDA